MQWLKHAFAIPPAAEFTPTAGECALAERVCQELVRRQLVLPASVLLESFRPLGFVASQAVWFSYSWFAAVTDAAGWKVLGQMLERPGSIDWLLDRLQAADAGLPIKTSAVADGNVLKE